MKSFFACISGALLLGGCLSSPEKPGPRETFQAEIVGEIDTVYSYRSNGSRGKALGLGVQTKVSSEAALYFWRSFYNAEPGIYLAMMNRDSTLVRYFDSAGTVAVHRGTPCAYSNSTGRLTTYSTSFNDPATVKDVPLAVANTRIFFGDSVYWFAMILDASSAAFVSAQPDTLTKSFEGSLDVSCPAPKD